MSSVPKEIIGTWTRQKISEEPPRYEGTFTLLADGHYEYDVLSGEEGGPIGAPSYGVQSHQQQIMGNVVINGFYMILHPTSNIIDGRKTQTDKATDSKYVWQIINSPDDGRIVLKLVGQDEAHFFFRNACLGE